MIFGKEFIERSKITELKVGQYKAYQTELGKESKTETYVKIKLEDGKRNVLLETGKNFPEKKSYLIINSEKFNLEGGKDPYQKMFEDFFENRKENFPTIKMAIENWKKVEEIKKKKMNLDIY